MFQKFKSFVQKPADVKREWLVFDATDKVLGRFATEVAQKLIGKHKPSFTPHVDGGDYVVVLNAEKIEVTGNKAKEKVYSTHSGFPGGLKQRTFEALRATNPEKLIKHAVRNMLPKNRLRDERLNRLKVVVGGENPYQGMVKAN